MRDLLSFCPFCGRGLSIAHAANGKTLSCPACATPLILTDCHEDRMHATLAPRLTGESFTGGGLTVKDGVLLDYTGSAAALALPEGIVAIGEGAFQKNTTLCKVILPNGVRYIGNEAFHGCSGLRSITLPDGIVAIGNSAFRECRRLEAVLLPRSLRAAGYSLFGCCDNLTEADLPMDMDFLGGAPHPFCRRIRRTQAPHCVTHLMQYTSGTDSLERLTLGRSVQVLSYIDSRSLFEVVFTVTEGWQMGYGGEATVDEAILKNPKRAAQLLRRLCREGVSLMRQGEDPPTPPFFFPTEAV